MNDINLPPKVRQFIYVILTLTSPVAFYLNQQAVLSDFWFGLYSVVVSAVGLLATINVNNKEKK